MATSDATRGIVAGAVAGAGAAALMLPLFVGAERAGILSQEPPARVVDRATAEADVAPAPEERTGAMVGSHLLYGAGAGAIYGALAARAPLPAATAGTGFGLVVWAAGYLGWLPAAGIWPRPWRQPAGDALVPVAAHLVYGLALGIGERALRPRPAVR